MKLFNLQKAFKLGVLMKKTLQTFLLKQFFKKTFIQQGNIAYALRIICQHGPCGSLSIDYLILILF